MTTPTPLDQQRQLVRDFVAASKQRSQRETTAQQQYASGEKAAQEQYASSERAAPQKYASAIKAQDDTQRGQKSQINQGVAAIDAAGRDAHEPLQALGVLAAELPPALQAASPRQPTAQSGDPLAAFTASAGRIQQLGVSAGQLLVAKNRHQESQRMLLTGAAIAGTSLVVAGYLYRLHPVLGLLTPIIAALLCVVGFMMHRQWKSEQKIADNQVALTLALSRAADTGSNNATNLVDGAVYVFVPASEFLMGSSEDVGDDDEHPQNTVYLDAFWIMQTEVTNAQFAQCVAAGVCSAPNNSRWQDAAYADYPVTDVDWNQASAYAQWAGGRLPTEAEWEKAARGTDGRTYPWGEEAPDASLANCCDFVGDTTPVGSYPGGASPYGALDMAGNVWEWTEDWYDGDYYGQSPAANPTGLASGGYRVMRGGSAWDDETVMRVAHRSRINPGSRFRNLGFRVASSSPGS